MQLVQAEFIRLTDKATKVVWVDASKGIEEGNHVTFEEDLARWLVVKVYKTKIMSEQINGKWGLNLPKSQRTER